eukprot:420554-Alexandrium_andersonii.AAC.1
MRDSGHLNGSGERLSGPGNWKMMQNMSEERGDNQELPQRRSVTDASFCATGWLPTASADILQ